MVADEFEREREGGETLVVMNMIQINVLGPFQVLIDGKPVTGFQTEKVRALLAYLAVDGQKAHNRQTLTAMFWPESPPQKAAASMRNTLSRLRRSLDSGGDGVSERLLATTRRTIRLRNREALIDVALFDAYLKVYNNAKGVNEAEPGDPKASLMKAADLYRGELLSDLSVSDAPAFEEWLRLHRQAYAVQAAHALSDLVEEFFTNGEYAKAEKGVVRLLEMDRFRESAHRQRMRLWALQGLRAEALAHFDTLCNLLDQEIGVEPDRKTVELAEQIRHGFLAPQQAGTDEQSAVTVSALAIDATEQHRIIGVPAVSTFVGRVYERARLQAWLVHEGCRVVSILGMGGVGKSTLAAQTARDLAPHFDIVAWVSLLNAPPLPELLPDLLRVLSTTFIEDVPTNLDTQLSLLLVYLRERRILLVLDNAESLLDNAKAGMFRTGYERYDDFLRWIAVHNHNSRILVTSRELPRSLAQLGNDSPQVRSLLLSGLGNSSGYKLLASRGLQVEMAPATELVNRYSGNPLALKLVADAVNEIFAGDVNEILDRETPFFDDIRSILDQQFDRLSQLEQDILFGLAVEREPMPIKAIRDNLLRPPRQSRLIQALRTLQRRSLVEHIAMDAAGGELGWGLQNIITEYLTDRLVETMAGEQIASEMNLLHRLPMLKALSKEYLRRSQTRMILQPVVHELLAYLGPERLERHLQALFEQLRRDHGRRPSYAGGNLLNTMLQANLDPAGADFSAICLWQASLENRSFAGANLSHADLAHSTFLQAFGRVEAVAINPDGRLLAGGGEGGVVRLYDLATYQLIMQIEAHANTIISLCFSPDGTLLASAGHDENVKLWQVETGKLSCEFQGESVVKPVCFSPDGMLLAGVDRSGRVSIWRVKSNKPVARLPVGRSKAWAVAFHPNGKELASAGGGGVVQLWTVPDAWHTQSEYDVDSSREDVTEKFTPFVMNLGDRDAPVIASLAYNADGTLLAAGMGDGSVRIGKATGSDGWFTLHGHSDLVHSVAFDPIRGILTSGSFDHSVRLWDVKTRRCTDMLKDHQLMVWGTAFTPDGRLLATGSADGSIRLWQILPDGQANAAHVLLGYDQALEAVAWSPDKQWIATGDLRGTTRLWQVRESGLVCRRELRGHNAIRGLAFSPDSARLATSGENRDNSARVWGVVNGDEQMVLGENTTPTLAVTFSHDGTLLACATRDGLIHIWDLRYPSQPRLAHLLRGHTQEVRGLVFSATQDGIVASTSNDQSIRLWDLNSGDEIFRLVGHGLNLLVQLSPSDRMLATAGKENAITLWSLTEFSDPRPHKNLIGHHHDVLSVAFSPDGRRLVSGSVDRSIRLWDVESGAQISTLGHHDGYVMSVAFCRDGQRIASVGKDGKLQIWHADSGECLHRVHAPGPYEGTLINGVTGITNVQRAALKTLGAVESPRG